MFSKELVNMIERFYELRDAVDIKIIEESNGLASLGAGIRFNVFINDTAHPDMTIDELESLVGPVEFEYNYKGNNCFKYNIGTVPAYTLLNEKITRAADDVSANAQT